MPFARRAPRWPRHAAALLAGTATLLLSFGAAAQKINDVPMAVKNNVAPNFMFMVDNSGSMTNIVPTAPYNENVDYTPSSNCSGSERLAAGTDVYIRITAVGNPSVRRPFIRVGNTYVKLDCERVEGDLRYILKTRLYRKPGQNARDPATGEFTQGQYESSTLFEEYQVGYGPAPASQ